MSEWLSGSLRTPPPDVLQFVARALAVAVDDGAAATRRRLGPRSWFVLEEVVLRAEESPDGLLCCRLGARALANALGMSKDTAARALGVLIECGLAERRVDRDTDGRYRGARLLLHLPAGVRRVAASEGAGPRPDRHRVAAPAKARRRDRPSQLSLIGGDDG